MYRYLKNDRLEIANQIMRQLNNYLLSFGDICLSYYFVEIDLIYIYQLSKCLDCICNVFLKTLILTSLSDLKNTTFLPLSLDSNLA